MPPVVVNGAQVTCSFGVAPSALVVVPTGSSVITAGNQPVATIMDKNPMVNIMPFGVCNTPSNPQVAAATAAAMGVLTPQPCIPNTTAPWVPGKPTVTIGGKAVLTSTSTCMCMWGGVITVVSPGQMAVQA